MRKEIHFIASVKKNNSTFFVNIPLYRVANELDLREGDEVWIRIAKAWKGGVHANGEHQ